MPPLQRLFLRTPPLFMFRQDCFWREVNQVALVFGFATQQLMKYFSISLAKNNKIRQRQFQIFLSLKVDKSMNFLFCCLA